MEESIQILTEVLHKQLKRFLLDLSWYQKPITKQTLSQNLQSFLSWFGERENYLIQDAFDNDLESIKLPLYGTDAIRWHDERIQSMSRIGDAIHLLNNSDESTLYVVDAFNQIKDALRAHNLWLV